MEKFRSKKFHYRKTDSLERTKKSQGLSQGQMSGHETYFRNRLFFRRTNWEEKPFHISRHCPDYYKGLLSCEQIDQAIREKMFYFGKNIDVTSYVNGVRETHNQPGRANAPILWDYYNNGCSIRILNPQTFFKKIHCLNAGLQEYFGCFVGANVYLTPSGSQGFAPHYDDIEAFVLQIEGRKHWKIYAPRYDLELHVIFRIEISIVLATARKYYRENLVGTLTKMTSINQ